MSKYKELLKDRKLMSGIYAVTLITALLILALVGNCGQVRGTCPSADGSDSRSMEWDLKQASDRLNLDVASSGRSADGIATLLDTIRTTHGDNANFAALYEDA